jgi:hypothetical protein
MAGRRLTPNLSPDLEKSPALAPGFLRFGVQALPKTGFHFSGSCSKRRRISKGARRL